jgi:hypothetical protein
MGILLKRAMADTFAFLGGWGLVAGIFAIPIVGLALHLYLSGPTAMMGEFEVWAIYGLAATVAVFLSIFVINLARTPLIIEREAHKRTYAELLMIKDRLPNARAPRHLNAEEQGLLAAAMKSVPHISSLNVIYAAHDEAIDFAYDIGDAIKAAKIECVVHQGVMFVPDPRDRGVKVLHGQSPESEAAAIDIQKCLSNVEIRSEVRAIDDKNFSGIFLFVARSPQL